MRLTFGFFLGAMLALSGAATAAGGDGAAVGKAAGHVVMTTNQLFARRDDGSVRALARQSVVYEGDMLLTGAVGVSQVRMNDGALVSLLRHSAFRIDRFNFDEGEDGSERGFFSLLRGGFRTLSGLIGHRNKANYRVGTPVATIGIRGTHYGLRLCQSGSCAAEGVDDDGLYGGVLDGAIALQNDAGEDVFGNDEFFFVAQRDRRPERLLGAPGVIFGVAAERAAAPSPDSDDERSDPADTLAYGGNTESSTDGDGGDSGTVGSTAGDGGETVTGGIEPTPLDDVIEQPVGAIVPPETIEEPVQLVYGEVASTAFLLNTLLVDSANALNTEIGEGLTDSLISLDGITGLVVETLNLDAPGCAPCTTSALLGTVVQSSVGSNTDLGVSWGRWSGAWVATGRIGDLGLATGDLHVMYSDRLTPENAYNQLSGSFQYDYAGEGTNPTNHSGTEGVLNAATVDIDFGAQQVVGYDLDLSVAGDNVVAGMAGGGVSFSDAANGDIMLNATCAGPGCGNTNLGGRASTSFVGAVDQGRPEGLISSYSVAGSSSGLIPLPVGYSGTFLAKPR